MRHIGLYGADEIPAIADIVEVCTATRRAAILPLLQILENSGEEFIAARPQLHELEPYGFKGKKKAALVGAYDHRTVAIKAMLATMQATLPAAHWDLCPFCNLDTGAELDHFLPKDIYPEFSLFPPNLLPICGRCNKFKSNLITDSDGERLFLFLSTELADDTRVLRAELLFQGALHVRYFINDGGILTAEELSLVNRHFSQLKLASRFSRRAQSHLAGLKRSLAGKTDQISIRVIEAGFVAAEAGEPVNSWNRALYEAINENSEQMVAWLT